MKQLLLSLAVLPFFMSCGESAPIKARVAATPKTFCNPVNIDPVYENRWGRGD